MEVEHISPLQLLTTAVPLQAAAIKPRAAKKRRTRATTTSLVADHNDKMPRAAPPSATKSYNSVLEMANDLSSVLSEGDHSYAIMHGRVYSKSELKDKSIDHNFVEVGDEIRELLRAPRERHGEYLKVYYSKFTIACKEPSLKVEEKDQSAKVNEKRCAVEDSNVSPSVFNRQSSAAVALPTDEVELSEEANETSETKRCCFTINCIHTKTKDGDEKKWKWRVSSVCLLILVVLNVVYLTPFLCACVGCDKHFFDC